MAEYNWGSFLPGGMPFRYDPNKPTASNIFGTTYDTSTWQPTETNPARNVSLGDGLAQDAKEKVMSRTDLINQRAKELGYIDTSNLEVNKMSMLPDISHINWSGILQGGKNIFGLGKNQAVDVQYPEKLQNNPFSDMRYADRQDAGRQGVHPPLLPSNYGAGMRGPSIHPMIDQPVPNNDWRYDNIYIHNKYGLPEYQGELTGRPHRGDVSGLANIQELGTEHSIIAPDKKRNFSLPTFALSGILKGLKNQFQRPEEKQAAYEAIMGDRGSLGNWESQLGQYGGNQYQLTNTPTGLKVGSDILGYGEGYEKNFDSAFGSKSLEEMEQKKIDWALGRLAKFKDKKGLGISQSLFNVLKSKGILDEQGGKIERPTTDRAKIEAYTGRPMSDYRASRPASERSFTGHGRSGMGRDPSDRMAYGGRVGYNEGGRVGILSVF